MNFMDEDTIPSWATEAVELLQDEKIMTGFGDGTFRPDQELNRAEALTVILRLKGVDPEGVTPTSAFTDVPSDAWFTPAVSYAVEQGWIQGNPDGTFAPGRTVNRAEWAIMLMRAFEMDTNHEHCALTDVPSQIWYAPAVNALAANELIREQRDTYQPNDLVDRADAAWSIAMISQMPRLMGTSTQNEFSDSSRLDSRRVAIKPRDFNAEKQGYDIEPKALFIESVEKENLIEIDSDDDWKDIGGVRIRSNLDEKATVQTLQFKFKFDETNVGPESNFMFELRGGGEMPTQLEVNRDGSIFLAGLKIEVPAQEEIVLRAFLKPKEDVSFYAKSGTGVFSVFLAEGTTVSTARSGNVQGALYRAAPVEFTDRTLSEILFTP